MKHLTRLLFVALAILKASCTPEYDDTELRNEIESLRQQIKDVETLLNASQNNLTISSVEESEEGFIVTFSDGSTILVKHGTNGKDGADGKDGDKGDKGDKGDDGADGENGKDGEDGKDGADGKDGKDGETLIESIIIGETEVTFILTSGKTVIIPLDGYYNSLEAPIHFLDNTVRVLCVMEWDTDGDQELSYKEAAAVEDIGLLFQGSKIMAFRELEYFTNLSALPAKAFYNCTELKVISLPESIQSIGEEAFANCERLEEVCLPESISAIEKNAFKYCEKLERIELPNALKELPYQLFYGCYALTDVTLPAELESIGERAFENCTSLKEISLPASVNKIDNYAFYKCYKLEMINIPEGIESIPTGCFYNCEALPQLTLPESVTYIGDYALRNCYALGDVHLGSKTATIDDYAFYNCTALEEILLPESTISIGAWSFSNCSALVSVVCMPAVPPQLYIHAFDKNATQRQIYVPAESLDAYKQADVWSDYASSIVAIEPQPAQ